MQFDRYLLVENFHGFGSEDPILHDSQLEGIDKPYFRTKD